jgi:hypothetical protein
MKLKVTNNWENLYWHIGETDVTAALSKVTLEFPDKSVHDFKVTWTRHQLYYAEQYNAFITLDVHGAKLKTNLNDIAKKRGVNIIDFKVKRP